MLIVASLCRGWGQQPEVPAGAAQELCWEDLETDLRWTTSQVGRGVSYPWLSLTFLFHLRLSLRSPLTILCLDFSFSISCLSIFLRIDSPSPCYWILSSFLTISNLFLPLFFWLTLTFLHPTVPSLITAELSILYKRCTCLLNYLSFPFSIFVLLTFHSLFLVSFS